ncbi:MAG: hypothetical protein QXD27_09545 [Metallosphaera sp.]
MNLTLLLLSYSLYGFFENAYWSTALAGLKEYVNDPSGSGLAASMCIDFQPWGCADPLDI